MRIKGLVSVIMPTFNRSHFLPNRIKELQAQTYTLWELIIVNDCSTDDTVKVVEPFLSDSRIKLIDLRKNSGCVSIPRAVGIFQSKGEFIAPTDDDVGMTNDKFEKLVPLMTKNVVLGYGNRVEFFPTRNLYIPKDLIKNWNPLLPNGWGVDNGQFLYRSNVFEKVPIIFPRRGCDWELAKLIKPLGDFAWIDKVISIYYWHNFNRSLNDSTKTKKIHPEEYSEYFKSDFGWNVDYNYYKV